MENIIHQITLKLVEKINEKAFSKELTDLDKLAAGLFEDCAEYARLMLEEVIRIRNFQIREDKEFRKQEGLVLKEKERPRQIFTKLGMINWERDYYYDKNAGTYAFPLDHMLGIRSYERVGDEVTAQMLNRAAIPEKQPKMEKKEIGQLHVYADEDHAHMQKPKKERGKYNQIVPLVTVSEGTHSVGSRRNQTIEPMHFVDEEQSTKELWKSVEGYLARAYDVDRIKKIYIHADGGNWVKNGLESFPNVIHVMDGYHFYKALRAIASKCPERNVKVTILNAIVKDDLRKANQFIGELAKENEEALKFGTYLFEHWEEIRNLVTLDIPGSCTEGQISHVLSERISRNPMGWSKPGLGKISKLRVYRCNGGKLTAEDLKGKTEIENYGQYADRFINENLQGAHDWSIFDSEPYTMDTTAGTQILIKYFGTEHGITGLNTLN